MLTDSNVYNCLVPFPRHASLSKPVSYSLGIEALPREGGFSTSNHKLDIRKW